MGAMDRFGAFKNYMQVPWKYIHTVKEHICVTIYQLLRTLETRLYSKCNLPLIIGFLHTTPLLPPPSAAQLFVFLTCF